MKRIVTKVVLQNLLATRFLLSSDDSVWTPAAAAAAAYQLGALR